MSRNENIFATFAGVRSTSEKRIWIVTDASMKGLSGIYMSNRVFERVAICWGPTIRPLIYEIDIQELMAVLFIMRQNYHKLKR